MGKSFYGGMDGRPFILKKVYPTISNMIDMFKNEINYGEYVLISNENRNHPDNGKLFKRVYAAAETDTIEYSVYNESTHRFEKSISADVEMKYIGAIVGPQGSALEFKLFDKNKGLNGLKDLHKDSEFIQTNSELVLSPDVNKKELFPGKPGSVITLKAYSFRDKNGNKSTVYLDVNIPYNVIEWKTTQLTSQDHVRILDDNIHPFYQWYELGIPKGQDGTSFDNIRVITPTAADDVVTISFDENRNITATKYEGLQDDIDKQRQIWVADVIDYKVTDDGTKYLVYLGDYNIINDIIIDEKGTITIKYNHNDDSVWNEKLTWIEGISLNTENGKIDIETNNEQHELHEQLNWVKGINIAADGTITFDHTKEADTVYQKYIQSIDGASITDGHLDITTNNKKNEIHEQLNWPINIAINPESGAVTYTDVEVDENGNNKTYSQDSLTWVKNLAIDEKGVLNTTTTTGKNQIENQQLHWVKDISIDGENGAVTYTEVDEKTQKTQHLRWVKDINITDTGYLNIETTTEANETHRQLHWVKDISINPDTGVVTYTDISGSTTTEILDWVKDISIDEEGTITIDYTNSENTVYSKLIDWIKEVSISQNGTVSIESNNGTQLLSPDQQKLKWLENVSLAQDGTFTKTDNQNVSVNQEQKLKWVDGVSLSQDGIFTQSYNNGETTPQQTEQLKWMEDIQIADNGVVTKVYNHGANDTNTKLKWPINIQLNSEDGTVTTTYNDNSINTIQNPQMDWIKSATLNDDKLLQIDYINAEDISVNLKTPNQIELTESGDFYATYNTGERTLLGNIGELNPISATAIAEGEEEPANLMAGGIVFITQDATTEG